MRKKMRVIIMAAMFLIITTAYPALTRATADGAVTIASVHVTEQGILKSGNSKGGVVSVKAFGAKGDGLKDDTAAIQAAIDSASANSTIVIPDGIYMILATDPLDNNGGGIIINKPLHVVLSKNTVLKAIAGHSASYRIINIKNTHDVVFQGGKVAGDRDYHRTATGVAWKQWTVNTEYKVGDIVYTSNSKSYTCAVAGKSGTAMPKIADAAVIDGTVEWRSIPLKVGEFGHGITVMGSSNIRIKNCQISNCWGDGIIICYSFKSYVQCSNIYIDKVISTNNRRQGLSIVDGTKIRITNSEFSNTNGTAPQFGIDIEPDGCALPVTDVLIDHCLFYNNSVGDIVMGGGNGCSGIAVTNNLLKSAIAIDLTGSPTVHASHINISNNISSEISVSHAGDVMIKDNVINKGKIHIKEVTEGDGPFLSYLALF